MCTATANGLWIVLICKQASYLLPAFRCSRTHVNFVWNLTRVSFWLFLSKSRNFLLKLRTDHSGQFAPREVSPLYGKFWLHKSNLASHAFACTHAHVFLVCVCMCACVYVCVCVHVCMCVCMGVCMHLLCVHMHLCMRVYVCKYASVHTNTHTHNTHWGVVWVVFKCWRSSFLTAI